MDVDFLAALVVLVVAVLGSQLVTRGRARRLEREAEAQRHLAREEGAPGDYEINGVRISAKVRRLLLAGKRVNAVKQMQRETGKGLAECVETIANVEPHIGGR